MFHISQKQNLPSFKRFTSIQLTPNESWCNDENLQTISKYAIYWPFADVPRLYCLYHFQPYRWESTQKFCIEWLTDNRAVCQYSISDSFTCNVPSFIRDWMKCLHCCDSSKTSMVTLLLLVTFNLQIPLEILTINPENWNEEWLMMLQIWKNANCET